MLSPSLAKQESCDIAKITARCALYMSALKVFELCIESLKCVALAVPEIIAIGVLVGGCEP